MKHKAFLREFLRSRRFRQGSLATVFTVLFIAVIVVLNMVVALLSQRLPLRIDLTDDQIFSLTEQSREFIAGLTSDVSIYVLMPEQFLQEMGGFYMQASEVIRQYGVHSPRITVSHIDLPRNPGFARRFPQYQLGASTVILSSGERTTTISFYDLFNIESDFIESPFFQTEFIASSRAEQVMTTAIMRLTMDSPPTVSFLVGFGESGYEGFAELLRQNLYVVMEQNLLIEDIHPDARVVVISAPARDYSEAELSKLDAFLYNGGRFGNTLIYFANIAQAPTPNLDAFLADWGISVDDGIVLQIDQRRLIANSPYWSVVDYAVEVFARIPIQRQLFTVVPESRPLTVLWSDLGQKSVFTTLYFFDESAVVQPLDAELGWSPADSSRRGMIPAMILSQKTGFLEGQPVVSNVVVVGSSLMMLPELLLSPHIGNAEYLLAVVEELTGREGTVYIAPRIIGGAFLPISEFHILLIAGIFAALLPVSVLVLGGMVFFHRRHL